MRWLVLLVLTGCQDPYGPCRASNYREPGPGCTAPHLTTTIDGDGAEWTRSDLTPLELCTTGQPITGLPPCRPGDVQSVQIAIDGKALAFHLITDGPPTGDSYQLGVYRYYDLDHFDSVNFVVGASGVQVQLNGYQLFGYAIDSAIGADGIELRFPIDTLPFVTGAQLFAGVLSQQQPTDAFAFMCWDPSDPTACSSN